MKPLRLTAAALRRAKACPGEVALFRKTFPKGTLVTFHTIQAAADAGLNVTWFYNRLATLFPTWKHARRAQARMRLIIHTARFMRGIVRASSYVLEPGRVHTAPAKLGTELERAQRQMLASACMRLLSGERDAYILQ